MAALRKHRNLPSLKVIRIDGFFFGGGEHADDATKAGSLLKQWEEVDYKSDAGMKNQ